MSDRQLGERGKAAPPVRMLLAAVNGGNDVAKGVAALAWTVTPAVAGLGAAVVYLLVKG
jgi:hypothetical protein